MQHMLNIGQSAYSQHLKITKGQESNTEVSADRKIPSKWEPKGKRMLQLKLTDGAQVIQAIEEVLIPQLHLDLIPGTKMLLKGPLECRRGVVILKPSNVELLGGEVSDLVGINAPENVLARIIGKTENPNPVYGSYSLQTANVEADQHDEGTVQHWYSYIQIYNLFFPSSTSSLFVLLLKLNFSANTVGMQP